MVINQLIHSVAGNGFHQNLLNKLYALYDFEQTKIPFVRPEDSEVVSKLKLAIEGKKQVILKNYKSGNSNQIHDRIVEPFSFTEGFVSVWCFEPASGSNKTFKVARIEDIEELGADWAHAEAHHADFVDVFRVGGPEKMPIKMYLNLRAYRLLIEEYPRAEQFVKRFNDKMYLYDGWVSNYEGVGRFVLGLLRDVVVLEPKAFKDFLNEKIAGKKF